MKESKGPDSALDLRGLALVTGGALAIVWGLVRGNQVGWGSLEVVASLLGGVALMGSFVRWELRARGPMLPMGMFRSRAFSAGNTAIFFTFASLFGAVFFYAQLLQTGLGFDPLGAGLRLLPWTAMFMTVAPIAGALADRIGERPLLVGGLTLQATGMAWLALIAEPGLAYSSMLAPLLLAGIGISMALPAAQNSVVGGVTIEAIGKAAGANSMMRELGGVFGIAVAVAVFTAAGSYASPAAFSAGFGPAIGVAAVLSLAGAIAGMALPSRRRAIEPVGGAPGAGARERGLSITRPHLLGSASCHRKRGGPAATAGTRGSVERLRPHTPRVPRAPMTPSPPRSSIETSTSDEHRSTSAT
jgi:predicted MFS family arabinose efflux permease